MDRKNKCYVVEVMVKGVGWQGVTNRLANRDLAAPHEARMKKEHGKENVRVKEHSC